MKNRLLLIILSFACSIWLHAQSEKCVVIEQVQVNKIVLGGCLDKPINDRYEIFSFNRDSYNLFNIVHKDVLVNSSIHRINVEVSYSNDSVFIREMKVEAVGQVGNECLRDLSYQIKVDLKDLDCNQIYLVLNSEISSISHQIFYTNYDYNCDYPVTEKLNYQYKPFIMDGTCEWIISMTYGHDGYKEIISNEDTVIVGKNYKKIYITPCSQPTVKEYAGGIREDNRKIFFIDKQNPDESKTKSEEIIYDFNLQVGGRIEYFREYAGEEPMSYEVSHIDTILLEGIARRRFYFRDELFETWTEGIGSMYVFTRPFPHLVTGYNPFLAGVWRNGEALFCDGYKCNCDQLLPISEYKSVSGFHIVKNPVENKILLIDFYEATYSKLDFYSFDGQLKLTKELNTKDTTIEVPLTGFQAGNYILILTQKDGIRKSCKVVVL